MSLIVEDGTGLANADSYLSVADADTYHSNLGNTSWGALSTPNKELALRKATKYLDHRYFYRWRGARSYRQQGLDWPRYQVIDRDGYLLDFDELPQALKNATAEAALIASSEDLEPDVAADDSGSLSSEMVKVGPVEISQAYVGGKSTVKTFTKVARELQRLLSDTGAERG